VHYVLTCEFGSKRSIVFKVGVLGLLFVLLFCFCMLLLLRVDYFCCRLVSDVCRYCLLFGVDCCLLLLTVAVAVVVVVCLL